MVVSYSACSTLCEHVRTPYFACLAFHDSQCMHGGLHDMSLAAKHYLRVLTDQNHGKSALLCVSDESVLCRSKQA